MIDDKELLRVGDYLDPRSKGLRTRHFQLTDNLAQRIFDPQIEDHDQILSLYVPSMDFSVSSANAPLLPTPFTPTYFSDYERFFLGKIFNSSRPIVFLEDSVGSGKTTTINHIREIIKNYDCQLCLNGDYCIKKKSIKRVNLDREKFLQKEESYVRENLLIALIVEVKNAINETYKLSENEEFSEFWISQLEEYYQNSLPSPAFSFIASQLSQYPEMLSNHDLNKVTENKALFSNSVEANDKFLILDYYVRKWGYIIREKYHSIFGCSFLWIDNIDKASLVTQTVLVNILSDLSIGLGIRILVTIRPETYLRLRFTMQNNGANVHDFIEHSSPTPAQVVFDRMKRFMSNPDSFYNPLDQITREEYEGIKKWYSNVFSKIINIGVEGEYFKSLNLFAGKSKRIGLLCAQKLLFMNQSEFQEINIDLNERNITRIALINQSTIQKTSDKINDPIANLYDLKQATSGRFFIKLRILQYLQNQPDKKSSLGKLIGVIGDFYPEIGFDLIRYSLTEMTNIYCQQIITDGFERFDSQEQMLLSNSATIQLTIIGENYITKIFNNILYIQEIMLDCRMPKAWIAHEISISSLIDKMELLVVFLYSLEEIDIYEVKNYLRGNSVDDYKRHFGDLLITTQIFSGIIKDIVNLCHYYQRGYDEANSLAERFIQLRETFLTHAKDSKEKSIEILDSSNAFFAFKEYFL